LEFTHTKTETDKQGGPLN